MKHNMIKVFISFIVLFFVASASFANSEVGMKRSEWAHVNGKLSLVDYLSAHDSLIRILDMSGECKHPYSYPFKKKVHPGKIEIQYRICPSYHTEHHCTYFLTAESCYNMNVCDAYKWVTFPGTENLVLNAGETVVLEGKNNQLSFFIKS